MLSLEENVVRDCFHSSNLLILSFRLLIDFCMSSNLLIIRSSLSSNDLLPLLGELLLLGLCFESSTVSFEESFGNCSFPFPLLSLAISAYDLASLSLGDLLWALTPAERYLL